MPRKLVKKQTRIATLEEPIAIANDEEQSKIYELAQLALLQPLMIRELHPVSANASRWTSRLSTKFNLPKELTVHVKSKSKWWDTFVPRAYKNLDAGNVMASKTLKSSARDAEHSSILPEILTK